MDEHHESGPTPAIRPCPFAIAAMTVPARYWNTRADLTHQLVKAEEFMLSCPLDDFRITSAAEHAGMSVYHFLRLFKEVYARTPYQFMTQRRIETAKQLLQSTDDSVVQIGCEVGFSNASAFTRAFRRDVGCTPSEYRARNSKNGTS